jgi:hypothetical protein
MLWFPLLLSSSVYAKETKPEAAVGHIDGQNAEFIPSNYSASETQSFPFSLTPSVLTENSTTASSDWEQTTATSLNTTTSALFDKVDRASNFLTPVTSTENKTHWSYLPDHNTNNTGIAATIDSQVSKESRFVNWIDPKEKAASAFIPEGWNADLQIIRPYNSMTGFVFFARGSNNSLVYVFQPFMPLNLLPSKSLCETDNICFSSMISAEKIREMSLGNAPMAVSDFKTPEQYFTSEVLPVLMKNLNTYTVESAKSDYALVHGNGSNSTDQTPVYEVDYNFNAENKKISGKALILTRNYTADNATIWNGFIVGIESSEKNFDKAFQQAAVTLLTLKFEEKWLNSERNVLLENANTSQALGAIPELMANSTLDDFNLIIPTAAYKLVMSYNKTMIAEYIDRTSSKEFSLPLFPDMQHWYLSGNQLFAGDIQRNLMNTSSLEPRF